MPSNKTPRDIFTRPEAVGRERCSIPVPQEAIDQLRADMEVSREDAFRFVDDTFANIAQAVWQSIGTQGFCVENGWIIFEQMVVHPALAEAVGIAACRTSNCMQLFK